MSVPGLGDGHLLRAAARRRAAIRRCRRWSRSARSAGGSWSASTGPEAAAEAEAHFDRVHKEHLPPEEIEEVEISRAATDRRRGAPAGRCWRTHFGISRSEARRLLGQGGVRLDGEPLGADELDVDAGPAATAAVLQVGPAQVPAPAPRALTTGAAVGDRGYTARPACTERPAFKGFRRPVRTPKSLLYLLVALRGSWRSSKLDTTESRLPDRRTRGSLVGLSVGEAFFSPEPTRRSAREALGL